MLNFSTNEILTQLVLKYLNYKYETKNQKNDKQVVGIILEASC